MHRAQSSSKNNIIVKSPEFQVNLLNSIDDSSILNTFESQTESTLKTSSTSLLNLSNKQKLMVDHELINLKPPLPEFLCKMVQGTNGNVIVVGIAGGSGSGKTTLAHAIYEDLGAQNITLLSHDAYYRDISHLTLEQREKQNFDHPDSLETSLLVEHIKQLKNGFAVHIPTYDYATHSRKQDVKAIPRPIILIEGILILSDKDLRDLMDIKIFVDTDDDLRLIRRIQRDTGERGRSVNSVVTQYLTTVRPMHIAYVEPSKRNADIIIPVGLNSVALDLVVSKLRRALNEYNEI